MGLCGVDAVSDRKQLAVIWWPLVLALLLGVFFRLHGLGDRVYWVDEVATSIRISGYTKAQITAELSDGLPRAPEQLQQFLHPAPDLSWFEVLGALVQSPEHTPLYFLLVHGWAKLWGSNVVAMRSFSVLCSIGAIVLMYRLASRLFDSTLAGSIAATLITLSPYFVSYAQEARPYSLWSVMLLWSALTLWSAMARSSPQRWLHYGLSVTLSLYTSLLSVLVLLGQAVYVWWQGNSKQRQGFGLVVAIAGIAFLPWLVVGSYQWSRLQANTEWMRQSIGLLPMLIIWLYSLVIIFFDAPVVLSAPLVVAIKGLTALLTLAVIGAAIAGLWKYAPKVKFFVASLLLPVPIVLIAIDLLRQGQASATPRYLFPLQLAVLLAVAGWLSHGRSLWRQGILIFLIGISVMSCISNLDRIPDYQKDRNRHNDLIAAIINSQPAPRLIAEPSQTLDLISLSAALKSDVTLQVMDRQPLLPRRCETIFLLNPSTALRQRLQHDRVTIAEVFRPALLTGMDVHLSLWRVTNPDPSCPSS